MPRTQTSNITTSTGYNPGSKLQFSRLLLKTLWNPECKSQLETRKAPTSFISVFSSEGWNFLLQSDPETDLLNYHVSLPHPQKKLLIGGKNKEVVTHWTWQHHWQGTKIQERKQERTAMKKNVLQISLWISIY